MFKFNNKNTKTTSCWSLFFIKLQASGIEKILETLKGNKGTYKNVMVPRAVQEFAKENYKILNETEIIVKKVYYWVPLIFCFPVS